ncbi:hypothetical protein ACIP9X_19215 [Arthrobacter sp. NPDC093125]|uniref:hypothetical protein n=1 Tax=Arthrobacter sp. NPDC093125 TaxID=3363944 RepID=UPI00381A0CCB
MAAGFPPGHAPETQTVGRLGNLLAHLLGSVFEAAGVGEPWRALLVLAVLAAVFVPLVRAAVVERRQLRAEGI